MQYLIPADHGLAVLGENLAHSLGEISLQFVLIFKPPLLHEGLYPAIPGPLRAVNLVAASVEVRIGKKRADFADQTIEESIDLFPRRVDGGESVVVVGAERIRSRQGGKLRVSHEHSLRVSRHLNLRDDADTAVARVIHQFAQLLLSVILPTRSKPLKARIDFALQAKAFCVAQVQFEDVHLYQFHGIEVALECIDRQKMAGNVQHKPSPCKSRLIPYCHGAGAIPIGVVLHKLEKGRHAAQYASRPVGAQFCACGGYLQCVGFIRLGGKEMRIGYVTQNA